MAEGVEDEISSEEQAPLTFKLGGASVLVQAIDGGSKVWLAFRVGKDEVACPGILPAPQHGGRPVCEWDNPASVLALAFPYAEKSEPTKLSSQPIGPGLMGTESQYNEPLGLL